jgi:hypothetical protein
MTRKLSFVILLLCGMCMAQGRVPVVTRTVQLFDGLERKLASDPASRGELLADDFEERLCADPGVPIPREDWLQKHSSGNASFHGEAVHELGDIAIYSALSTFGNVDESLVDVWKKANSGWKLAIRYRCPATGEKPKSAIEKRY